MVTLDARFTALVIFCGLATQWAGPIATAHAAVISRTPDDRVASFSQPGLHSQHVLPWSGKGQVKPEGGRKHKVRMNDYHPTNPFGRFIDGIVSKIKRPHGSRKLSHRSIIIPNNHGGVYAVPRSRRADTPLWRVGGSDEAGDDQDDSDYEKRDEGVSDGFVAIKSDAKTLAYLVMTTQDGQNVLNASEKDKTLVSVRISSEKSSSGSSDETPVTLQIHPPTADSENLAVSTPLCATYDPNPTKPQPMTVIECFDETSTSRTTHGSQMFLFNKATGVIQPTWHNGQDDGMTDKPAAAQVADVPSSSSSSSPLSSSSSSPLAANSNSTSATSASAAVATDAAVTTNGTLTSTSALTSSTATLNPRGKPVMPAAKDVTLVFIPSMAQGAAVADVDSSTIDPQSDSSAMTTTTTRTVTVFAAETVSSSSTASDSAAAASQTVSSIGVQLVSGTPSATSTSVSSMISAQALETESSSSVAAAASVTPAPSSSVNAAAVASSLASSASASSSLAAAAAIASASASASTSVTPEAVSSGSASSASTADSSSNTFVAAVMEREAPEPKMTGVSTAPYQWMFAAEQR